MLKYIICFLISMFFISCGFKDMLVKRYYLYIIENNSIQNIKIENYTSGLLKEEYNISSKDKLEIFKDIRSGFSGYPFKNDEIDSTVILSESKKALIVYCNRSLLIKADTVNCPGIKKNIANIRKFGVLDENPQRYKGMDVSQSVKIIFEDIDFK